MYFVKRAEKGGLFQQIPALGVICALENFKSW